MAALKREGKGGVACAAARQRVVRMHEAYTRDLPAKEADVFHERIGVLVQEARLYLRTAANELATQATLAHDEAQFAQQRAVANEKHVNQAAAELKVAAARVARIARDVADNRSFTDNAVPSLPL